MSTIIKQRKLFWAWQDEQEEAWLNAMAQQGLHVSKLGVFGGYEFEVGQPRNDVYRLDYRDAEQNEQDYLQLFADAGWQHMGSLMGWQYFRRQAAPGKAPQIFSDAESKVGKYRRQQKIMLSVIPFNLLLFSVILPGWTIDNRFELGMTIFYAAFFILLFALLGVMLYKLEQRIRELQAL